MENLHSLDMTQRKGKYITYTILFLFLLFVLLKAQFKVPRVFFSHSIVELPGFSSFLGGGGGDLHSLFMSHFVV